MSHIIDVWLSPVVIHGMHLILLQLVVLDLNRHLAKRNRHPMGNHLKLFPRKRLRQGHHHQGQIHKCKTVSNFHYYRLIYHDCSYLIKNNPKLVNLCFIFGRYRWEFSGSALVLVESAEHPSYGIRLANIWSQWVLSVYILPLIFGLISDLSHGEASHL